MQFLKNLRKKRSKKWKNVTFLTLRVTNPYLEETRPLSAGQVSLNYISNIRILKVRSTKYPSLYLECAIVYALLASHNSVTIITIRVLKPFDFICMSSQKVVYSVVCVQEVIAALVIPWRRVLAHHEVQAIIVNNCLLFIYIYLNSKTASATSA